MEKLYEVTLCSLNLVDSSNGLWQHVKDKVKEKPICIMHEDRFVNIENNQEYEVLKNPNNAIVCCDRSLDGLIYALEARQYSKENFSESEVSKNYLQAIKARRILNNKTILEQHDITYQKRR